MLLLQLCVLLMLVVNGSRPLLLKVLNQQQEDSLGVASVNAIEHDTVLIPKLGAYVIIDRPIPYSLYSTLCFANGFLPISLCNDDHDLQTAIYALKEAGKPAAWIGGYWRCGRVECEGMGKAVRVGKSGDRVEVWTQECSALLQPALCRTKNQRLKMAHGC